MTTTTTTLKDPVCPCCHGAGTQYNQVTGLVMLCPCCGGSGHRVPERSTWG